MEKKRTTIITSETHEVFIFRRPSVHSVRAWCGGCAAEVEMLKPEEASLLASVSTRTIYRWAEAGLIHFAETPAGLLIICGKSLTDKLAISEQRRITEET